MLPVDIGCAAAGSQVCFLAAQPFCDKVPCMPLCLKTHKVRYRISSLVDFRDTRGGCPADDPPNERQEHCSSTKVGRCIQTVHSPRSFYCEIASGICLVS